MVSPHGSALSRPRPSPIPFGERSALPNAPGDRRQVVRSALARVLTLIPTAAATLFTSRLVIHHYGIEAFGVFALLTSLILLIPLNNLGAGGPITNAFAERGPTDPYSQRVTLTATRILVVSSAVTLGAAAVLGVTGAWPAIIGIDNASNLFLTIAVGVWAMSFVPGLGQSMLLGVHRNEIAVFLQAMVQPVTLLGVGALVLAGVGSGWVVIVPSLAFVAVNLGHAAAAARAAKVSWSAVLRAVPFPRTHPGTSIRKLAGPLVITSITVPIALQCDRIVLSHVSTTQAVADYTVAIQLFAPIVALIGAASQPLWPIYARARARGETGPPIRTVVSLYLAGSAVICAVLVVIADPLGNLIGAGEVHLGLMLPFAAALTTVLQAATFPVGMALMDERGVRFVALMTTLQLPVNVALSIVLGAHLGAPGPLFATALTAFSFGAVPPLALLRRRERAAAAAAAAAH